MHKPIHKPISCKSMDVYIIHKVTETRTTKVILKLDLRTIKRISAYF